MAKRRMFSLDIIDTDNFIDMPQTTRLLYYELCMRADDDGFVSNPKKIQKMVGCSDDDFKVLITKQFIIPFNSGVVVIKHWRIHNYIQNDRYKTTLYTNEKSQLSTEKNGSYFLENNECIQNGSKMDTQVRLGKVSLDQDRLDQDLIDPDEEKDQDSIFNFVEKNFGRTLSPIEYEKIASWEDNELTRFAIKESVLSGARGIRYVETVLASWKAKGFKTPEDVEHYKQNYKNKKEEPIPNWMNKDSADAKMTPEEEDEWNKMMEGLTNE